MSSQNFAIQFTFYFFFLIKSGDFFCGESNYNFLIINLFFASITLDPIS